MAGVRACVQHPPTQVLGVRSKGNKSQGSLQKAAQGQVQSKVSVLGGFFNSGKGKAAATKEAPAPPAPTEEAAVVPEEPAEPVIDQAALDAALEATRVKDRPSNYEALQVTTQKPTELNGGWQTR